MHAIAVRPLSQPLNFWLCLGVPAVLAVAMLLLELTSLDMDIARLFYDASEGGFVGRHSFFLEDILHDRAKQMVIVFSELAIAGFAGAVMMLALVFDPRYRSFPSAALVLPALVYLVRPVSGLRREIALLAFIIGAGIAPQLFREGLMNQQAWGWAVVSLFMVVALWRCLRVRKA